MGESEKDDLVFFFDGGCSECDGEYDLCSDCEDGCIWCNTACCAYKPIGGEKDGGKHLTSNSVR
jgi:hypothetical protein